MNERVLTVCEQQVSKTVVWFSSDWFLWSYIYYDFFQPQFWIIFSSSNPYLVLFFLLFRRFDETLQMFFGGTEEQKRTQTRGLAWKYSAAISGQYHNVPVNYNIMLLSHHRLETLTPHPIRDQERRTCGLQTIVSSESGRNVDMFDDSNISYTDSYDVKAQMTNDR